MTERMTYWQQALDGEIIVVGVQVGDENKKNR